MVGPYLQRHARRFLDAADDALGPDGGGEGVHRLRVAARRLRFALGVLSPHGDGPACAHLSGLLRAVARPAGVLRDDDVLRTRLRGRLEGRDHAAEALAFQAGFVARRRARARKRMGAALAVPALRGTLEALARGEDPLGAQSAVPDAADAERVARDVLGRDAERVRACWPSDWNAARARDLHDLRIELKRVRYHLELLAPVLGDDSDGVRKQAKRLQVFLGEIQDARVARRHARRLARAAGEPLRKTFRRVARGERAAAAAARHEARGVTRAAGAVWERAAALG